jgi:large repetitive protein
MLRQLFFSLLMVISINSFAQTYNLHWGSAGITAGTFNKTITNVDGSGITAVLSILNSGAGGNTTAAGTAADNNAFQNNTPITGAAGAINWFLPGTTGSNPLVQWVDWSTLTSNTTTKITFSQPVTNVSFYLGDMDVSTAVTYVDRITFTGKNGAIVVPNPIVTKFQATKSGLDTVLISGNSAYGNSAMPGGNATTGSPVNQGATIQVQFSNQITELTFVWDEGPGATGNPAGQAYIIGDIAFSKVIQKYPYPPTADNFINIPIPQGNTATSIPALTATDLDGTIATYTIATIPLITEGVLSYCSNGTSPCTGTVTNITVGTVLTPAQMATLKFDPAPNYIGTTQFTFSATDNDGTISNTATYKLPVIAIPPVSNNIMENSMPNTNGPTTIQGLSSSDVDGTISSYNITTIPLATEGVLSYCSNGTAPCTGTVTTITAGTILTAAQMATLKFDPAAGFIGNATFNYNAVDNNGNISNTANYTIPVTAAVTTARPPLADNITAQPLNNSVTNTSIPSLKANDLNGTVTSYTITTLPSAASGVLRMTCPSTPTGLTCVGGFADVIAGTVLTAAEAARMVFDPASGFVGIGTFTYTATDNTGLVSNVATYNLPIVNTPPTAANINAYVSFNAAPTAIPALSGSDADGIIANYTITTVPTAAQGIISVPCPATPAGGTCIGGFTNLTPAVLAANPSGIVLTPSQAAGIRFAPTTNFSGIVPFSYTSTDNNGNTSAAANYNIIVPVQPPVTNDITNAVLANTLGATAVNALSGSDLDGTIASYKIFSVPGPTQGIISIPCPATPTGATCTGGFANLTQAVLDANLGGIVLTAAQAASLRFDPTAGFTGLAPFKYGAVDNNGLTSNISTYTIPVSGTGNIPPVAKNILAPFMVNTNAPTVIPTLAGSDADGTIASYTLASVPAVTQGVLSIPCPATPTGATCTAGFADLTAAVLTANPTGIVLTPAQAAAMRFDPAPGFSGNADFAYITTDNSGSNSAGAIYTIPVISLPPVSNAVIAPSMSQANGPTVIPGLIASDIDGTIVGYNIESLPSVSQGVISIPCPATPTGATCTGGFADLTAAVLTNYTTGGIPLSPTQMAGMRFDPAPGYSGNVVFNYHAIDNSSLISNSSTYTIPVSNLAPKSEDILAPKMTNTSGTTSIPTLSSVDADGTISNLIITGVPPTSQGVISIPCPATPAGATCTGGFANLTAAVLAANPGGIVLTPAQAAALRFTPLPTFTGTVTFNYAAYDNNGNISNVAAYTIPVGDAPNVTNIINTPPVSNNFINTPMPQGNAATLIPGLVAADADGTIANYTISTIPTAAQGVLSYCSNSTEPCTGTVTAITAGTILTPTQMATLKFDPAANFVGNAQFTFTATDNTGNVSNTATYQLPVIAQPPVSNNIMENSMVNTNGSTAIQGLNSSDVDGTIASYTIATVPPVGQGVLSYCSNGTEPCTGTVTTITAGTVLSAAQIATLKFDPATGFVGNATFNYTALDNSGNTSNTANYTIPVTATPTPARPPLADNITAQQLNNSLGATSIPPLQANDLDGTVATYTIATVPPVTQGVISYCSNGTEPCTGIVTTITAGTLLTPAQAATLKFDPAPGFTGTASFTYTAKDNSGLVGNTATYNLPIVNTAPVSTNIKATVPFNGAATAIPALSAADADGTITNYTISTIPTPAQGILSYCSNGTAPCTGIVTTILAGTVLTPAQAATLKFAPAVGFSGTATFAYTSTDNNGNISAPATYSLTAAAQPPVSIDVTATLMPNTNGPIAIAVLNATDADGTIASYNITSLPSATQGVLSIPCPFTPTGATCTGGFADLTDAVLANYPNGIPLTPAQAAGLRFDPAATFTGVASFNYTSTDNLGLVSNTAKYNLPVSGTGNIPPVAKNINATSMSNAKAATAIPALVGADADGTIASYTLVSVPTAAQGVLSITCPATPTGATCTGGFADLTPAVLAANPAGIVLTSAQAAAMRFDPAPGFTGTVNFSYVTIDNLGAVSGAANYAIPVMSNPPIANAIVSPSMSHNNGATLIPGLVATDADGTIANYTIETIPTAAQGILSYCSNGTEPCTGTVTTITAGTILTPAQIATLKFDPAVGYTGNVVFDYHATDNSGMFSNTTSYTIPVLGVPPASNNVLAPRMNNANGPTSIPALVSADADGTINDYVITSVPKVSQGILSIPCPATPTGATCTGGFADITEAVLAANPGGIVLTAAQVAGLRLDPAAGYNGNIIFNYAAYDNNGNLSNVAAYTIPVTTVSVVALSITNFSGQRNGNDIDLKWRTENEINVSSFEVEYSIDATNFKKGGSVAANNGSVNNYSFTLYNYVEAVYFIRLKSIDKDGSFKYSNIIKIINKQNKAITIYPNPVKDKATLHINDKTLLNTQATLINADGRTVRTINIKNAFEIINLSSLPSGLYVLKLANGTNEKIIKE